MTLHNGNVVGVTASDSWRLTTAVFRVPNGVAATAPRCFPTEPTFGARATTVWWWLGKINSSTTTDVVYLVRILQGYVR